MRRLIGAIRDGDEQAVEQAVVQLSQTRRLLAPLGFVVGAFVMLFNGLRLVVLNWRLAVIQVLPAMWIWAAMLDLKLHVIRDRELKIFKGPLALVLVGAVVMLTAASFYLNATFAFAVSRPGPPDTRFGFAQARGNLSVIALWGVGVGIALGIATVVAPRWGRTWFAVLLSGVVAVMMICYVAVPGRITGMKKTRTSQRDKVASAAVGGAIGAAVCAPPYLLGRLGLVLLGSHALFSVGVALLTVGIILYAGTTGAVKAIKVSTKLVGGRSS